MKNIIFILLFIPLLVFGQGTEMISNGTFDNTSSWTPDDDWFIADGVAHFIYDGTYWPDLDQLDADMVTSIEANSTYIISFTCVPDDYMCGGWSLVIESTSGEDYIPSATYQNSKYTIQFTTPSDIGDGGITFKTVAEDWSLDNVSLKKIDSIGDDPYYVAPDGDDTANGDINHPWKTMQKAFDTGDAGDTIYFRGGVYYSEGVSTLNPSGYTGTAHGNNGTRGNYVCYFAYPDETPIWDCINHPDYLRPSAYDAGAAEGNKQGKIYNQALNLVRAEYFHFKGITVRNVKQAEWSDTIIYLGNTEAINPSYCANTIFENFTVHDVGVKAFYISSGVGNSLVIGSAPFDSDTSYYINVDVYNVADSASQYYYDGTDGIHPEGWVSDAGNSADAFKFITYDYDTYYEFTGCRAWNYSDDGMDMNGWAHVTFKNCWLMAGLEESTELPKYEGNGFKATAEPLTIDTLSNPADSILKKYINCIVFDCAVAYYNDLMVGFGDYNIDDHIYLRESTKAVYYNNLAYHNEMGMFDFTNNAAYIPITYRNNLSFGATTDNTACGFPNDVSIRADTDYRLSNNNWYHTHSGASCPNWGYNTDTITVTADDFFYGLNPATIKTMLTADREADWSLPPNPFILASTSDCIDAGIQVPESDGSNVVLTFNGTAPDIGVFEYEAAPTTPSAGHVTLGGAKRGTDGSGRVMKF